MPQYIYDGGQHYDPASAKFVPENLEPYAYEVFDALRQIGITAIRCRYDGGQDEGFSSFSEAVLAGENLSIDELKQRLAASSLGEVPASYFASLPDGAFEHYRNEWDRASRAERVGFQLDLLADVLAVELLGIGYGTGDFSIDGRYRADFMTGEIIDESEEQSR